MKAEIAKVKKRNETKYDKQEGIIKNGHDNAYPQRMERIIKSSVTANAAAKMYANFLVGNGFSKPELNNIVVGYNLYKPITMYDLLEKICNSIAQQKGSATKLRYNAELKIDEVDFIQYKNCRFGKADDIDYSGKVIYYNNWDKSNGKVDKTKFIFFDIYNSNEKVILSQIANAAKKQKNLQPEEFIRVWNGQVAFLMMEDEYIYPLSTIDAAQDDADTEYQISLFKNGELSRNFFAKYMLKHAVFETKEAKEGFIETITEFTGAENNGSIMVVQGDITQDGEGKIVDNTFALEKIEQNIDDKLFESWEKSIPNNIRKCFNAIPPVLIDYVEGSLGNTSGEQLVQAAKFYNQMTKKDRQKISNYFSEIFKHFKTPIIDNFEIEELKFGVETSSIDEINKQRLTAQATLRGSVGGVTSLLEIQKSVAAKTTDINSGIAIIQEIYGISEEIARKMLGSPESIVKSV